MLSKRQMILSMSSKNQRLWFYHTQDYFFCSSIILHIFTLPLCINTNYCLFFLARVMQYKDQPNLEILHILLQSSLRVTIMKLKTSTPLKIDTWILLLAMKLLLILSLTPKSLTSILSHFSFHNITLISLISHMSLTKEKNHDFSQVFFIITLL